MNRAIAAALLVVIMAGCSSREGDHLYPADEWQVDLDGYAVTGHEQVWPHDGFQLQGRGPEDQGFARTTLVLDLDTQVTFTLSGIMGPYRLHDLHQNLDAAGTVLRNDETDVATREVVHDVVLPAGEHRLHFNFYPVVTSYYGPEDPSEAPGLDLSVTMSIGR